MLDPQMKRGLLETCVLSALCREDSYGYKIVKDLSAYVKISESTLYPILRRLDSSGCLNVYSVEHNGRLRKIYSITRKGQEQISAFLNDWEEIARMHDLIKEGFDRDKN